MAKMLAAVEEKSEEEKPCAIFEQKNTLLKYREFKHRDTRRIRYGQLWRKCK